MTKGF